MSGPTSRRTVLGGAAAAAGALAASALAPTRARAATPGVTVTTDGEPRAVVAYRPEATGQVAAGVASLVHYVKECSGAELVVVTEDELDHALAARPGWSSIHVGFLRPGAHPDVTDRLIGLDDQGYVIAAAGSIVTIIGGGAFGTRFGSYEFLERHLGVRWLLPGRVGEDVPVRRSITVPYGILRDEPVFKGRAVTPFFHNVYQEWTRTAPNEVFGNFNRAKEFRKSHHVLGSIFDPKKYATSNPEFFPIYDGVRHIPPSASLAYWQPRLTPASAVEVAVAYSTDYFRRYPQFNGYSLSPNDDGAFSDDEFDQSVRNSVGALHVSEVYFSWVNKVAERMAKIHPDKTCGVYAYVNTWDPPSFELHPNVIIFLTQERLVWATAADAARDRAHHEAWQRVAHRIGWYDYQYGMGYSAPRITTGLVAEQYRWAAQHGVADTYVEVQPFWGEGPKPWVTSKLLWNPHRSPEQLTREWCDRSVGQRSGAHLAAYFRLWERIWTRDIPGGEWFRNKPREDFYINFFPFQDPSYLEDVDLSALPALRALMDGVVAGTDTEAQAVRARSLALAFDYYESSVLSHPRRTVAPTTPHAARRLLADTTEALDTQLDHARRRAAALATFRTDPVLSNNTKDPTTLMHSWTGWNLQPLWDIAQFIRARPSDGAPVQTEAERLAERHASPQVRQYLRMLLAVVDGRLVERGSNMSFDEPGLTPWTPTQPAGRFFSDLTREPFGTTDAVTVDGTGRSLHITGGARRIVPAQRITGVTPGFYRFSIAVRSVPGVDPVGYAWVQVRAVNAAGATLVTRRSPQKQLSDTVGRWTEVVLSDLLPEDTVAVDIQFGVQAVTWEATVHVDDARFVQLVD